MQLAKIETPNQLTDIIQSLVTGSFEKKFKGLKTMDIVNAFAFATQGLNQAQLQTGIKILLDKGYCPDPALFRQWCLGNTDFKSDDEIADSYIGKHGALASITKWLETDGQTPISMAEKHAFDETYSLWQNIQSQSDRSRAELAFKDYYTKIVADLVKARIACQGYVAPVAICQVPKPKSVVASKDEALGFLNNLQSLFGKKGASV